MKSICGYWALDGAPAAPPVLGAMRSAGVHHADPHTEERRNDEGTLAFGSAWWSPQPDLRPPQRIARHPQTGCIVVADARLDNPEELRAALQLPAPEGAPDNTTDHATTLILHAWLRWCEDCVDHIDGDFAFAVFDPRIQKLYLARDRMGQRPLYVHHQPGRLLVFGSTSHAVLAHPRVPRDFNDTRIADYLIEIAGGSFEGADFTATFHSTVERHPPRHASLVSPDALRRRRYWHLEPGRISNLPRSDDAWAEAVSDAVERAVAQRLASAGRAGSMLSGGMDSTSLAIVAGEQLRSAGKAPLPTFSAVHTGLADCKETAAVLCATQLPLFHPVLTDLEDAQGLRETTLDFISNFDEPFDVHMALLDAQYANAARLGVSAIIDGANGDSLFLFSGAMRRALRRGHWRSFWQNAKGLSRFGGKTRHYLIPPIRSALTPPWVRPALQSWRDRRLLGTIVGRSVISNDLTERIALAGRLERFNALRSNRPLDDAGIEAAEALQHTFPVVGAERYFRIAARHGITPLTPFTARHLLELFVNLPDDQRLRNGWTKWVLREAMQDRMPESVRLRSDKQHLGWRTTMLAWEQHQPQLLATLQAARPNLMPYVDGRRLHSLLERAKHPAASIDTKLQLFSVAQFASWLQRWK